MIHVNLLPGARKKRSRAAGISFRVPLSSLVPKFDKIAVGAIAAVVLSVASMGLMFFSQSGRAQELTERERKEVQDSVRYAAVLRDRRQAEASRDAVLRQLAIIQSIDDRRYMWPHILEELSNALPPFTWLTNVIQVSAPPSAALSDTAGRARGQAVDTSAAGRARAQAARREAAVAAARAPMRFRVVGNTVDIQALTRFMRDLETSPFIQNVTLARSDLVMVEQKEVTEFQLEAESEPVDTTVITVHPLTVELR